MMSPEEATRLLENAEMLCPPDVVDRAVRRVASEISGAMGDSFPLVLQVMRGATVFCGQLLPLLDFPLELDYLHASRYGSATRGASIQWFVAPREDVVGRHVLVVDDILDEGITIAAVRDTLIENGARSVRIAVFCEKDTGRAKPVQADFVGLHVPDRYVFGFGMDVRGVWRNLPAVYALDKADES